MPDQAWFEESTEQSQIKREIVAKYFWSWAKIMIPRVKKGANKVAYIDLFAGPGRYKDGTKSTPLLVLETAIREEEFSKKLVTIFNDMDLENTKSLEIGVNNLPGIEKLKYKPVIMNHEIGTKVVEMFEKMRLVPTFFFVDPWGYKGLSLRLINSVLKDWGCDCVFFFNYNRINMGLNNEIVKSHMDALFGEERANGLRQRLSELNPEDRENAVVEEIAQALKDKGGEYVLPFRFRNNRGTRTSHYLMFVSKNVLGYTIMKGIMAGYSSSSEQGVPSFEYCLADERFPLLFEFGRPLDDLYEMLLNDFKGRKLTLKEIFEGHHVGKPYIIKNYQEVLKKLETEGRIITDPPADKRPKRKGIITFSEKVVVTFP